MDHVIESMNDWLRAYDGDTDGFKDEAAIECIKNALEELQKYYTEYDNER